MTSRMAKQEQIHLGTHGENYGSWMSTPVFVMIGGGALLALVLAVASVAGLRLLPLGAIFAAVALALVGLFALCLWVRRG